MGQYVHGQNNDWLRSNRIPQQLRNDSTEAERLLWRYLRGRQFGVKFRRQHPFGGYVLDFASLEAKLVIELDGGQHAETTSHDAERDRQLTLAGFHILRFWNNQVFQETEAVIERIMAAIAETHPHPCPPLEGEGVNKVL